MDTALQTLMTALDFDVTDFTVNATGQLSERQRTRLLRDRWKYTRGYAVLALIMLGIALLPAIRYLSEPALRRDSNDLTGFGFFFVLTALLVGQAVRRWQLMTADAAANTVAAVCDRVTVMVTNPRMQGYKLKLPGIDFEVREKVASAFRTGVYYRIFYTPRSRIILSADEMRSI